MKTSSTTTEIKKNPVETLADNLTGMKYKRLQVKNRQYIRNLLRTNQQLLKDNNINSLILF
ncbi:MAG TPA: hypothetical protein VF581_03670 [Flavobacterium sp.]|jgi:hypothetical protein